MTPSQPGGLTRRQLLIGGAASAGAVLLGACGSDGEDPASDGAAVGGGELFLTQFFPGSVFAAGDVARMPFGLADAEGLLPVEDSPATVVVDVFGPDESLLRAGVEVASRSEGLARAYYPLAVELEGAGFYTVRAEVEGSVSELSVEVAEPGELTVLRPGQPMPAVETPTTADPRGVDPVCTGDPACPLHDVSLAAALGTGQPIALLVATPAFCQIAICGPVLDILLDVVDQHPAVQFLHAEVYARPHETLEEHAPIIEPLGLQFEPCLFLVDGTGTVVERVDTIYDRTELGERLAALT